MELNQNAIELAVIDRLTDQIMGDWDWQGQARSALSKRIDEAFRDGVSAIVDKTIKEAVQNGFDHEYLKAADVFGKPTGQPTTVRKELARLIENYWTQRVDRNGNPTDSSYDTRTRAEWTMVQVCGEGFQKDLKQEVVNITAGMKDGLRAQLRASMDGMLNDLFRVKSTQDRAEKLS